jgi:hypothetical protein
MVVVTVVDERGQGITVKFTQLFCWQPRAPTQNETVPGKFKEGAKSTVKITQLFCWQPRAPTQKKRWQKNSRNGARKT